MDSFKDAPHTVLFEAEKGVAMGDKAMDRFNGRETSPRLEELEERQKTVEEGNAMLDTYTRDEAHTLSHELSKLNMRWSKFNDNIRIRRAVLEATQRSRSDFHTAFADFEDWLDRIGESVGELETLTANTQSLKDTAKRREWIQQHKSLEAELNAHEEVLKAVDEMGRKLGAGLESGKDRTEIQTRLDAMGQRWKDVRQAEGVVKLLIANLVANKRRISKTQALRPRSGNKNGRLKAYFTTGFMRTVLPGIQVREAVTNAHSFLMQHDLRPKLHRPGVLAEDDEDERKDVEQRRCGLQIHVDCEKLKEKWAELGVQFSDWDRAIHAAALRLQELERALAECQLHLSAVESEVEQLRPVERLRLEELKDARRHCESLTNRVADLRIHVDDANDAFMALKTALRVRTAALRNALADFGPSSEHFLNQSVSLPWQRAISKTNQLPYYIDHTTEKTQWEHPVWVEMAKELSQFNRVKFIAYRTAMKLRALQKRLCLDLVDIPMLEKCFSRLAGLSNEELPGLEVIFNLVAQDGQADQKHIALLLYDLIQIPRLVGEAAAFGGSNVEPSVRSCFETVRLAPTIGMAPFLDWMKQEPQSVVWLPVMHR
ncbi:WW domain protein, partial [Teladorsagia circumcincta]